MTKMRFETHEHLSRAEAAARLTDYIWVTPDLAVESAWVGQDAGSDHLPVFARLSIPIARTSLTTEE